MENSPFMDDFFQLETSRWMVNRRVIPFMKITMKITITIYSPYLYINMFSSVFGHHGYF